MVMFFFTSKLQLINFDSTAGLDLSRETRLCARLKNSSEAGKRRDMQRVGLDPSNLPSGVVPYGASAASERVEPASWPVPGEHEHVVPYTISGPAPSETPMLDGVHVVSFEYAL